MLGYVITRTMQNSPSGNSALNSPLSSSSAQSQTSLNSGKNQEQKTAFFTSNNRTKSSQFGNSAFNASGFTQNDSLHH
jgi:hypothetical protein